MKKIDKQPADPDNFGLCQGTRNFTQGNMGRHKRDRDFSAGQQHREIFYAAALGKEFGLSREFETGFVHPRFMNRAGHDCIELVASCARDCLFQRSGGRARRFDRRLA